MKASLSFQMCRFPFVLLPDFIDRQPWPADSSKHPDHRHPQTRRAVRRIKFDSSHIVVLILVGVSSSEYIEYLTTVDHFTKTPFKKRLNI